MIQSINDNIMTEISSMTCRWAFLYIFLSRLVSVNSAHDHGGVFSDVTGAI